MKSLRAAVVSVSLIAAGWTVAAEPEKSPSPPAPKASAPKAPAPNAATLKRLEQFQARQRFAPMWVPVPKFPADASKKAPPRALAGYAPIWQPEWQQELGISAEQIEKLLAIDAAAKAEIQRHTAQFERLSAEEKQAEIDSWQGKPAAWVSELGANAKSQIEAVLTPQQLATIKQFLFPSHAVALLYNDKTRGEIGFGLEQETSFRDIVREKLTRAQQVALERSDKMWNLLKPEQQAQMPEVVQRHGPTSKILSLANQVGFEPGAMALTQPMMAEEPVRKRLKLTAEQEKQFQDLLAATAARTRAALPSPPGPVPGGVAPGGASLPSIETLLSADQLAALKELRLRREADLALSSPETRTKLGLSGEQRAALAKLDREAHERLYRIDREQLDKALAILSPEQRDKLTAELDRRSIW